jgi:diguanylate cyclase (GGDEF)-like protein
LKPVWFLRPLVNACLSKVGFDMTMTSLKRRTPPRTLPGELAEVRKRLELEMTERRQTEADLSWELEASKAIAELSSMLLAEHFTIEDISQLVLQKAQATTRSTYGFVGHIDPQSNYLVCSTMTREIWSECQVEDKDLVSKAFHGLWGWVLEHNDTLLTNHPADDPRSGGIPAGHLPIRRFAAAPAAIAGKLVGIIALANSDRDYAERDLQVIKQMAWVYAIALQRTRMEDELRHLSTHDALTGLYNRTFFEIELERLSHRRPLSTSIVVVDVDGLKTVNDRQGHPAGDRLLQRTAQILMAAFRAGDVVARIGGDEFAVLLPSADRDVAQGALDRLRTLLQNYNVKNPHDPLSFSMGAATGDEVTLLTLVLKQADDCMYLDKQSKLQGDQDKPHS